MKKRSPGDQPREEEQGQRWENEILLLEGELLRRALKRCKSTREIARYLGVSQPTVVRKMKKHGLSENLIHN